MQLRRLEAYGFKSFADKLNIEFDQGITAIVGPNGSGKSNITDAIRWVLGEQNIRNLRGAKTEDIIFSGSTTRRALGIAEVSLTFDNSDGQLPLDFQEVIITRRLFRSGESECYINKTRCRLKDIYDLFADTGLGRDAISVISQNKIDQVLNSHPEERRLLFEETAGITKYRNRKKESLKKMADTQQNILRVTDVLREIEHQLGPLAEQAEKTRKYNAMQEIYQQCKITLLINRYEEQKQGLAESQRQKAATGQANQDSEVQLKLLEVDKERLSNETLEVEKSLQLLAAKNEELGEKIERNHSSLAIAEERLRQNAKMQEQLIMARQNRQQELTAAQTQLSCRREEQQLAKVKADQLKTNVEQIALREHDIGQKISAATAVLAKIKQQSFDHAQELLHKENNIALCKRDLAELVELNTAANHDKLVLQAKQAKQAKALTELKQALETLHSVGRQRLSDKQSSAIKLQQIIEKKQAADEKAQKLAQDLNLAQTRRRFLQGMQEEHEGFGRAVKQVLKNNCSWQTGICGAVAEVIKIDNEHITALEIALGGALQNIITTSDEIAKQAIAFLKQGKLGRVTFLPLNTITPPSAKLIDPAIAALPGVIGYANTLVRCDERYRKVIDFLLLRTLVVDNIETGLKLARQQNYRIRIVTLAGEVLNPGGSLTGGSNARREISFLNRASEITALGQQITATAALITKTEQETKAADTATQVLRQQLNQAIEVLQQLEVKQAQQTIYVEQAIDEQQRTEQQLVKLNVSIEQYQSKQQTLQAALITATAAIEQLANTNMQQQQDDKSAKQCLDELNQAKIEINQTLVDRKIAQTVAEQEIIRLQDNERMLADSVQKLTEDMQQSAEKLQDIQQTTAAIQVNQQMVAGENERLKELRAIASKDHTNFYQIKMDKLVKTQEAEQKIRNLRKVYNDLQHKMHEIDLLYTKYAIAVNNCVESLQTDYNLTVAAALAVRLPDSETILRQRIASFERELGHLGSINPNAISEYEAMRERYGFLKKQSDDLIVAKEYLVGIIGDIDVTMAKQFAAAFMQISNYFSEIFSRLFGGGVAKLALTDDQNILETGIEIFVQPPNKKLQNLAVLSGGERALTVIALLFAFLQFRPAPFSVVDEIDASLDEANVDRFAAFLKEYAVSTQFIVVTHRKGTMQVADVLHGVTAEDSGVSKIISVKLAEQLAKNGEK